MVPVSQSNRSIVMEMLLHQCTHDEPMLFNGCHGEVYITGRETEPVDVDSVHRLNSDGLSAPPVPLPDGA